MAIIGGFIVTWQQVILCISFVAGGVTLGLKGKETLAAGLIGAAAGYLMQRFNRPRPVQPHALKRTAENPSIEDSDC